VEHRRSDDRHGFHFDQEFRSSLRMTTKVLAGGAALKQCTVAALNVDHVGQTAFDAVAYLESMSPAVVCHG